MYKVYEGRIAADCRESFGLGWILGENALYLSTWVLAGALVWPVRWGGWPVPTILWALIVAVVQVLLKKHNCSGCYYHGKSCHLGWGRISAWLFAQDAGDPKTGMRLALFYIIPPPLFLVLGVVVGLLAEVGAVHWVLLGAYAALNGLILGLRPRGCRLCAMREACAGSAARSRG